MKYFIVLLLDWHEIWFTKSRGIRKDSLINNQLCNDFLD